MKMHFSVLPIVLFCWTLCAELLNSSAMVNTTVAASTAASTFSSTNITTVNSTTVENSTFNGTSVSVSAASVTPDSTSNLNDDEWLQGLKTFVFVGFWVVVALVIFLLIPTISISLDRMYCQRHDVKTYTVNRRDCIGVELQEATSATLDGSDKDVTTLMLPEPMASICDPTPTTPLVVEHRNELRFGEQSRQTTDLHKPYETVEIKPTTESLDSLIGQLTNLTEADFTWPSQVENPTQENLRDRSKSAGDAPNVQLTKNLSPLYTKPQKGRKGPEVPLSNVGQTSQSELWGDPGSESAGGKTFGSFHLVVAKGDQDAAPTAEAPTSPEEWRNPSYLHFPSAVSKGETISKWKPKLTEEDEALKIPSNPHLSRIHVYEELRDPRSNAKSPDNRLSVSESNLLQSSGCKITIPQYFEVNDYTGIPYPNKAQPVPFGPSRGAAPDPLPNSVTQLVKEDSSSDDEEDGKRREEVGYECAIKVHTREGLMASSLSTKHRLSDGALERPPFVPPPQYGSLQRFNVAAPEARKHNMAAYYSKLNRNRPPNQANLPISSNVYNRLVPPVDQVSVENWAGTLGGDMPVFETSL